MTTVDNKIIAKVRKLFAMSQSTSVNEASIALRQMQSLMKKHGIKAEDLETSEFGKCYSDSVKRLDKWKSYLGIGIAAFTNTIVTIERKRIDGENHKVIVYKGFAADAQNALMLQDYLYQTLERCLKVYKAESGNNGRAARASFSNGFALALQKRMVELAKEDADTSPAVSDAVSMALKTSSGTSLVSCKQKMVEAEYGRQRVSKDRSRTSDRGAANAGDAQGRNVNLNRQVSGQQQKQLA